VKTIDDNFLGPQGSNNSIVNQVFISKNTKTIGGNAFKNTTLVNAISSGPYYEPGMSYFPSTLTSIGINSFQNSGLLQVFMNKTSVPTIPNYAFEGCQRLMIVSLPTYFQEIQAYAFANSAIKSLVIPFPSDSTIIRNFADNAFYNCANLTDVYFEGTTTTQLAFEKGFVSPEGNGSLINATWHLYSEYKPTSTSGSYWHYDKTGYPVVW
jgi:hypothetical protein